MRTESSQTVMWAWGAVAVRCGFVKEDGIGVVVGGWVVKGFVANGAGPAQEANSAARQTDQRKKFLCNRVFIDIRR